jgi:hypothetical protein
MVAESLAITIILLAISFIFLRKRKTKYAVTTLPLILVPLFHILFVSVAPSIASQFGFDEKALIVALNTSVLIISCILLGLFSHKISSQKSRMTYLTSCGGFLIILSWLLSTNILSI